MNQKALPLLQNEQDFKIINSDVEGGLRVKSIQGLYYSKKSIALAVILTILSGFIFLLFCHWSLRFRKWFFFKKCNLQKSTHFGIVNENRTIGISVRQNINGYCYIESQQAFKALEYELNLLSKAQIHELAGNGIIDPEINLQLYGPCKIEIPIPSVFAYLLKELTTPFYILQYLSCILWVIENYAILAIVMISVSVIITSINYFLLMSSIKKLRKMAENKYKIKVFRPYIQDTEPCEVLSENLVPGDIIVIENKQMIPCDCILLSGELMMNEASLTGESIPVPKFPLEKNLNIFKFSEDKRNCLFEGTRVLINKPINERYVLGLVVRTGFNSFKGQVFRSVLYPNPSPFTFYRQAIKFLAVLAIFILAIFFIELSTMINLGLSNLMITTRFFDAITWIIPPALPIFVSMCMTYSLMRLRFQGIFGVDPQKALVAGEVNTICFDKTGTLTTISIDVYGYQTVDDQNLMQDLFIYKGQAINKSEFIFKLFGSCHCVSIIDNQMMGDSLDIEMFKFSNYTFEESNDKSVKFRVKSEQNSTIDVLRILEFESQFQRMSVIVRDNSSRSYYIYCKGSPEKICDLVQDNQLPVNLKQSLESLTMKGLRVLGLGIRKISFEEAQELCSDQVNRDQIEINLQFMGLLVMENKLKHDTAQVIQVLKNSGLDLKVISGDNGLTTIQCARECNIIDQYQAMLLVDYNEQKQMLTLDEILPTQKIQEESTIQDKSESNSEDDDQDKVRSLQLTHNDVIHKLKAYLITSDETMKSQSVIKSLSRESALPNLDRYVDRLGFAVTGKAFDYFWAQQSFKSEVDRGNSFAGFADPLSQVKQIGIAEKDLLYEAIVKKARVFARMRPEQKSQVVEQLQQFGRKIAMIGDGANDCAAIKQADIGISFAQSDASYSAPFSSMDDSIGCVVKILLDGRAALTNTIEVFQYYVFASVIKYIGAMLMAIQGQNYSTIQMLYVNYVATIPYLKGISLSGPSKTLTNQLPIDDMFRQPNQISIYFNILVTGIGLSNNYIYWLLQNWHEQAKTDGGQYYYKGYCQTTIFMCLQFYFTFTIISMYISAPFKIPIYRHKILSPLLILLTSLNLYLFFGYSNYQTLFQMQNLQDKNNYLRNQFLITIGFCIFQVSVQELFIKRVFPCHKPVLGERKKQKKSNQKVRSI